MSYNRCLFGSHGRELYFGRLAQLVEHRLYTPAVTGSSPVPPTSHRSPLAFRALAWESQRRCLLTLVAVGGLLAWSVLFNAGS
jgi:hypothetical protein